MTAAGYKVGYTDYKIDYPGTTVATDVQRMRQAGVDLIVSCMDVLGNINLARAVQQYGLKIITAVAERERQVHAGDEQEPDAGCLFRHPTRPVHRTDL